MPVAIAIENLSKKYLINHQDRESYISLREVVAERVKALGRKVLRPLSGNGVLTNRDPTREEFWALKDINLEIKVGDRVGIIGRNGAGKSTLLKILSRITEPTTGRISIKGRVASLLEVGTGFHPELTGRENIILNGAVLGMKKQEIARKFDEIVEFAGVARFLDTPVKRYSSGMYLRLAFSVAAHLEPEILLVDEVLAVGDAEFQKKCIGKMESVAKAGRTVVFVSHNLNAIEQVCNTGIWLDLGRVKSVSRDVGELVRTYLRDGEDNVRKVRWRNSGADYVNPWFRPLSIALVDEEGHDLVNPMRNDAHAWVRIVGEVSVADPALTVGYALYTEDGLLLYWSYHTDIPPERAALATGTVELRSRFPARLLNEGNYLIKLIGGLHCREWLFEPNMSIAEIGVEIQGGLSDSVYWTAKRPGVIAPAIGWEVRSGVNDS